MKVSFEIDYLLILPLGLCQCAFALYYVDFTDCGGVYTNTTGFIISPNYPGNYPNNKVCNYTILGRTGDVVRVNFTDFTLESSAACR